MATSRSIQGVRNSINRMNTRDSWVSQGWCETLLPTWLLDELSIEYETEGTTSAFKGGIVYAPAWVYATWFLSESRVNWERLRPLLVRVRDDENEREMISAELALSDNLPLSAKQAARRYLELVNEKREIQNEQYPQGKDR